MPLVTTLEIVGDARRTGRGVERRPPRGLEAVVAGAELGEIGGKDGAYAPGVRTDPGEPAAFVSALGVDTLAVACPVPLVLHGSSGVSGAGMGAPSRPG